MWSEGGRFAQSCNVTLAGSAFPNAKSISMSHRGLSFTGLLPVLVAAPGVARLRLKYEKTNRYLGPQPTPSDSCGRDSSH